VWANVQKEKLLAKMSYDLLDDRAWVPLFDPKRPKPDAHKAPYQPPQLDLTVTSTKWAGLGSGLIILQSCDDSGEGCAFGYLRGVGGAAEAANYAVLSTWVEVAGSVVAAV
jgi:hypothetical protein